MNLVHMFASPKLANTANTHGQHSMSAQDVRCMYKSNVQGKTSRTQTSAHAKRNGVSPHVDGC